MSPSGADIGGTRTVLVHLPEAAAEWARRLAEELPHHHIVLDRPAEGPVAYAVVAEPPAGLVASLRGLELIISPWAGVNGLLAPGVTPPGVPIARLVEDGLTRGMVEWVLAQALAWHRNLFAYDADQRRGLWRPRPERLARERTVAVLGAGALGRPAAEAFAGLGFVTRVWSRTLHDIAGVSAFSGEASLADAVAGVDLLVNLLPLTPYTEGVLSAALFDRLGPGAFLINVGRGAHLVDDDLIAALDSGRLSGAALDVFREEPLPRDHPFWTHAAVRLSPHVAAPTHGRTAAAVIADTVRRWERGEPLANLVDRARGY